MSEPKLNIKEEKKEKKIKHGGHIMLRHFIHIAPLY